MDYPRRIEAETVSRYTTIRAKLDTYNQAASILPQIQALYTQAQSILDLVALYQAGTDATFNEAVNLLFTAPERQKLGQLTTALQTMVDDWETIAGPVLTEQL